MLIQYRCSQCKHLLLANNKPILSIRDNSIFAKCPKCLTDDELARHPAKCVICHKPATSVRCVLENFLPPESRLEILYNLHNPKVLFTCPQCKEKLNKKSYSLSDGSFQARCSGCGAKMTVSSQSQCEVCDKNSYNF